jgi:hypothetical protein
VNRVWTDTVVVGNGVVGVGGVVGVVVGGGGGFWK